MRKRKRMMMRIKDRGAKHSYFHPVTELRRTQINIIILSTLGTQIDISSIQLFCVLYHLYLYTYLLYNHSIKLFNEQQNVLIFIKDVSSENIDHVLNLAHDLDIPINFFNSRGHCGGLHDVAAYEKIADATDGLVYPLKTGFEIAKIGRVVVNSLRGSASVSFGGGAGRPGSGPQRLVRKQALGKIYVISVDDSIERVVVKVTTQRAGAEIILISPDGKMVTKGRVVLTRGAVYDIAKPLPGVYRLIVPDAAGQHKYRVNAVSKTNIDFGYYFVYIPRRGRNRVPVPLDQPLQGIMGILT